MSEKHQIHERKNFYKYLCWFLVAVIIVFGMGYCNPFNKTFNDFKYNKNNINRDGDNGFIPDRLEKDIPNRDNEDTDLEENNVQKKTSNYFIRIPSNQYRCSGKETLNQLSLRWHIPISEIVAKNEDLQDYTPNEPIPPKETIEVPKDDGVALEGYEKAVLDLTNKERQRQGLKPLLNDSKLSNVAGEKSSDMASRGYFSHTSPTYGSPFDMMKKFGVTYKSAGENIAKGQRTPEEVVKAWMDSPGHRQNIMNASFTHIGIGYQSQGGHLWTQMFISK